MAGDENKRRPEDDPNYFAQRHGRGGVRTPEGGHMLDLPTSGDASDRAAQGGINLNPQGGQMNQSQLDLPYTPGAAQGSVREGYAGHPQPPLHQQPNNQPQNPGGYDMQAIPNALKAIGSIASGNYTGPPPPAPPLQPAQQDPNLQAAQGRQPGIPETIRRAHAQREGESYPSKGEVDLGIGGIDPITGLERADSVRRTGQQMDIDPSTGYELGTTPPAMAQRMAGMGVDPAMIAEDANAPPLSYFDWDKEGESIRQRQIEDEAAATEVGQVDEQERRAALAQARLAKTPVWIPDESIAQRDETGLPSDETLVDSVISFVSGDTSLTISKGTRIQVSPHAGEVMESEQENKNVVFGSFDDAEAQLMDYFLPDDNLASPADTAQARGKVKTVLRKAAFELLRRGSKWGSPEAGGYIRVPADVRQTELLHNIHKTKATGVSQWGSTGPNGEFIPHKETGTAFDQNNTKASPHWRKKNEGSEVSFTVGHETDAENKDQFYADEQTRMAQGIRRVLGLAGVDDTGRPLVGGDAYYTPGQPASQNIANLYRDLKIAKSSPGIRHPREGKMAWKGEADPARAVVMEYLRKPLTDEEGNVIGEAKTNITVDELRSLLTSEFEHEYPAVKAVPGYHSGPRGVSSPARVGIGPGQKLTTAERDELVEALDKLEDDTANKEKMDREAAEKEAAKPAEAAPVTKDPELNKALGNNAPGKTDNEEAVAKAKALESGDVEVGKRSTEASADVNIRADAAAAKRREAKGLPPAPAPTLAAPPPGTVSVPAAGSGRPPAKDMVRIGGKNGILAPKAEELPKDMQPPGYDKMSPQEKLAYQGKVWLQKRLGIAPGTFDKSTLGGVAKETAEIVGGLLADSAFGKALKESPEMADQLGKVSPVLGWLAKNATTSKFFKTQEQRNKAALAGRVKKAQEKEAVTVSSRAKDAIEKGFDFYTKGVEEQDELLADPAKWEATMMDSAEALRAQKFRDDLADKAAEYKKDRKLLKREIYLREQLGTAANQLVNKTAAAYILGDPSTAKDDTYIDKWGMDELKDLDKNIEEHAYRAAIYNLTGEELPAGLSKSAMESLLPTLRQEKAAKTALRQAWFTATQNAKVFSAGQMNNLVNLGMKVLGNEAAARSAVSEISFRQQDMRLKYMQEDRLERAQQWKKYQDATARGDKLAASKIANAQYDRTFKFNVWNAVTGHKIAAGSAQAKLQADAAKMLQANGGAQVPAESVTKLMSEKTLIGHLDVIQGMRKAYSKDTETGPLDDAYHRYKVKVGFGNVTYEQFRSYTMNVLNTYVFAITGKQMSQVEVERIKAVVPKPGQNSEIFDGMVESFRAYATRQLRDKVKGLTLAGFNMRGLASNMPVKVAIPKYYSKDHPYKPGQETGEFDEAVMTIGGVQEMVQRDTPEATLAEYRRLRFFADDGKTIWNPDPSTWTGGGDLAGSRSKFDVGKYRSGGAMDIEWDPDKRPGVKTRTEWGGNALGSGWFEGADMSNIALRSNQNRIAAGIQRELEATGGRGRATASGGAGVRAKLQQLGITPEQIFPEDDVEIGG